MRHALPAGQMQPERAGLHALKRIAQPAEIAQALLFLAGPMSSFGAGTAMYVDGGNAAVK